MQQPPGDLQYRSPFQDVVAPILACWLTLLALLAGGCGSDDPVAPGGGGDLGGDPGPNPVTPVWDPADFTHVYEVGPGQTYADPNDVPWESLEPSTLVLIHWRAEPYACKWVLNTTATADDPLVVLGVPDAGRRPVITGDNATTRTELSYWNEVRSVIKVGGSNLPTDDVVPAHVTIQSLDIRSGRPAYTFTDDAGNPQTYAENAAAIHIEIGSHITVHDCLLHDCGNGLFAGSGGSDVTISGNHVYDNGIDGSIYHHNSYTECLGITFEYNYYGPLRNGALGNNLKDRSAGTVIRYNRIESGNRQLDLVETDYVELRDDPSYDETFVYGNLLIEPDGAGNSQVIHYGGDGGDADFYRRGTLYLYHNTVVSTRAGNTTLLRCATNDVTVEARNNILFNTAAGANFAITSGRGQITLTRNWLPAGWRDTHESSLEGTITVVDNIEGTDPLFTDRAGDDYRLQAESACAGEAAAASSATSAYPVNKQYEHMCGLADRVTESVGAFEPQ